MDKTTAVIASSEALDTCCAARGCNESSFDSTSVAIAEAASAAGHGNKKQCIRPPARNCMSRATLLKKLNAVRLQKPRKQRSDAGDSALTREEAMTISGTLMEIHHWDVANVPSAWKFD